jgi:hydrogenase-4 component B
MLLLLLAVAVLVLSGVAALVVQRNARICTTVAAGGALAACALGTIPAIRVLIEGRSELLRVAWNVPYGTFFVTIDGLSALFLATICVISAAAAAYGSTYLLRYRRTKSLGPPWFFFNLLVASMLLVVVAHNAVLFLVAWELMALASFFLVTFEDEDASARQAGWVYLVATHFGTAFLLGLFVLLGRESGSLDFDGLSAGPGQAGLLFLLAVVGFGTKAGFMPLHVWLPEAHPAAPSHVSAVMSGVMIKTGIYGLLRVLTFLGTPAEWWGWLLCGIGITSGVGGVLFALAQHDLKRLLAYHSVENIGIIALGLGVGVLGVSAGTPEVAALGFAGALLHVINHACFKGLLFLNAGAVAQATGTREIDHLGGLLKRMPWTGVTFLVGAVAISGLPPLNGFVSEWLIYMGSLRGLSGAGRTPQLPLVIGIGGLALIGGLAAACFTKAFGIVFLGEARGAPAGQAEDPRTAMRLPMLVLAAGCVVIGLLAPLAVSLVLPGSAVVARVPLREMQALVAPITEALTHVAYCAFAFLVMAMTLGALRRWLVRRRPVAASVTWDCGYARPSRRMQYTASSFAQPLTDLFQVVLRTRRDLVAPTGLFPSDASFATHTADVFSAGVYEPLFTGVNRGLSALRWLQHGRVHLYVLYIAVTLLVLLVWKLG